MTGITHAAAGSAVGAALAALGGQEVTGAVVGAVAALLPDMDHPGSYSGRMMRPLAVWLEEKYGHRNSPTHTLLFCLTVGLILGVFVAGIMGSAFLIFSGTAGAISHLVLDGMTRSGIQPLRLFLPMLPGRQWRRVKEKLESASWTHKKWSGPIYTGKDSREFVLAVFCILLTLLIIGKQL
ncbi:membrane-bound metal-dependent hydrolase [Desulforamulus reducens MI-1]|uniref:Membrane-bound metal-dependent hydrolase n=1 Tax=Desulforamulus reducens (strain ATCC BAA-1160 / DSM 100696 / MI-1) TaxID=349161 RepID=A4J2S9_DESRM|nr:metal-dependent hydrolase [Desulforamulus reducens]ABO49382.1 membrane-bound metal-dependent hydrolase [Desulforamulus reducens MI-1]